MSKKVAAPGNVAVIICINWEKKIYYCFINSYFDEVVKKARNAIGQFQTPSKLDLYIMQNEEWDQQIAMNVEYQGWSIDITLGQMI